MLKVLALQGAPNIYNISALRVKVERQNDASFVLLTQVIRCFSAESHSDNKEIPH
jgi:hypothetical protein